MMLNSKICIINGMDNEDFAKTAETELSNQIKKLEENGAQVSSYTLRDMKIGYCIGCWDCWIKSPGRCRIKDDQESILKSMAHADHIIFISEVKLAFISATLKRCMDRMIPNILPYIRIYKKEYHHYQRYENKKSIHTRLIVNGPLPEEESSLIKDYFDRVALNFGCQQKSFQQVERKGDVDYGFTNM